VLQTADSDATNVGGGSLPTLLTVSISGIKFWGFYRGMGIFATFQFFVATVDLMFCYNSRKLLL
jgi:Na+/H+ antiporter NhaD/arsenite permease-like protein